MNEPAEVPAAIAERVRTLCLALPEATVRIDYPRAGTRSDAESLDVRRRSFCLLAAVLDQAGGSVPLLVLRAVAGEREALLAAGHPFFATRPGRDRIGVLLTGDPDWEEIRELVIESYRILAPGKLTALVGEDTDHQARRAAGRGMIIGLRVPRRQDSAPQNGGRGGDVSHPVPPGDQAGSGAAHEAEHARIADMLGLLHQKGYICNVKNPDFAGGAAGDGTTDDTAAITAAIQAAHGFPKGGIVEFPYGVYGTSAPLVAAGNDIWFVGPHGLKATMGGAGNTNDSSATIKPLSTWAQGSASQPAAILVDAIAAGRNLSRGGIVNLNVSGANLPPSTLMHGIATYGYVGAWTLHDFIVASIANAASIGVNQIAGPARTEPQGNSVTRGLVQSTMGGGVVLSAGDATIEHIHTQSTGGNGITITGRGGDTRLSHCRGDLAAMNGFHIDVPCGQYLGMVQLSNCSTQRNGHNGIRIANSAGGRISVVYCTGCVFQGDGTAGPPGSGIRLSGPVGAVFTGCGVQVNSGIPADGHGTWPAYAITTAADGMASPVFLDIHGGFYNAATAFANVVSPPVTAVVDALEYHGGQWAPDRAPAHITAL